MIIDFHTHIFPEKIVRKAIKKLADIVQLVPAIDGSAAGLLDSMEKSGINTSIVLPVVTDVNQFDSVLRFASYINETYTEKNHNLISIAGIHPDDPDYKNRLQIIKEYGFAGIKFHPNYQGIDFSDMRYKRLLYAASELDLFVLTHAGYDPCTPDHEYCTPDMILEVLKDVAPEKLIAAHLGSNENYDEAEAKLCGHNLYLDTAYSLGQVSETQFLRMVKKHGADKILFATDCPWGDQASFVQKFNRLDLTQQDKDLILYHNAARLLKL